jgi:hypothetical protein
MYTLFFLYVMPHDLTGFRVQSITGPVVKLGRTAFCMLPPFDVRYDLLSAENKFLV